MHPTKIKDSEFYAIMLPKGTRITKKMLFPKEGWVKPECEQVAYDMDNFDEYLVTGTVEQENGTVVILYPITEK